MVTSKNVEPPGYEQAGSAATAIMESALLGHPESAAEQVLYSAVKFGRVILSAALVSAAEKQWPTLDHLDIELWAKLCTPEDAPDILYNLGVALWAANEVEGALASMRLAVQRHADGARMMLAEAQMFLRDFENATENLSKVILLEDEDCARAKGLLGSYFLHGLGRSDEEVISLLEGAGRTDPRFPVDLAEAYLANGDVQKALTLLQSETNLKNSQAPILLGNVLADLLGDETAAEAAYRAGVDFGDAFSAYNLAALLDGQGRLDESQHWLAYAAQRGDERASARLAAGQKQ